MRLRQFPDPKTFAQLFEQYDVVPLCREILADTETPVSVLQKIYNRKGPAFLLESVEGGERWGRYSFLSTSARMHIRIYHDRIDIHQDGKTKSMAHGNDPFPVLREMMKAYQPAVMPDLPRFWGGLVGYLTYETVSFFEAIPSRWPQDKPLAHFIMPDEMLIFDNIRNTLMMVAIAYRQDLDTGGAERAYGLASGKIDALEATISNAPAKHPVPGDVCPKNLELNPLIDEETFRGQVKKIISHIIAGDVIQTVLSQPFVCDAPEDILSLYRAQRYVNPSPYLFFLHLDHAALVGSSPETMVRLENRVATLRPIAGTRPRGKNEQEDRGLADELLKDEKERAEHLMLVDLGRNDLGRVAETGTVQVTDLMVVERYSHVMHLVSNINCDLKSGYDAWDLMRAGFPAGTLSGAPKVRAMELIAALEDHPRGPYGGAVGYISFNGNMDLAITIRTAMIENNRLTVNAGAGIVYDSDPERERIETVNKAMAIQKALGMLCQAQEA
jgi:anthranilate synthase component 1